MGIKHRIWLVAGLLYAAPALAQHESAPAIPDPTIQAAMDEADCWLPFDDANEIMQPALPLTEELWLLEVPCWQAAYQAGSIFLTVSLDEPDAARLLHFPVPDEGGFTHAASLTFPDYDPDGPRITSLHRARGLGDCGSAGSWIWSDNDFVLEAYWHKDDCNGILFDPFDEPEWWRVYP
jgi:hypothetical protein